jgi:signal transduction histidine kinase
VNAKYISTIRWKFIWAFILSILSGSVLLLGGYRLVNSLLHRNNASPSAPYSLILKWIINNIGSVPVMTTAGIVSFLFFFFLYTRKIISYLEEITNGIQQITKLGESRPLEVRTSDELGVLAENINIMSERLQHSLLEERKAVQGKNELITGVSHDLRTPLTSILGYLEYIEQDRCREETEIRYYVGIAFKKALVLRKLIDDLFEYTRVNSGGPPLVLNRLDLKSFIRQIADEAVPELVRAGMTYDLVDHTDTLWIQGAPYELLRAYENLITNAIRYGREGKKLEIVLACEGEEAVVTISNFGAMIAESDLPHIFERFYRAERSRSTHTGGSGLGLAIAKGIMERHHGQITARSDRYRTDFITRFPLSPEPS